MNRKNITFCFCYTLLFLIAAISVSHAQQSLRWIDLLEEDVINGRLDHNNTAAYQRLPKDMEADVRDAVWYLSKNSAGLYVNFKTTAKRIRVRYGVKHGLQMPHMPATGVSGVDLYAQNAGDGEWYWAAGKYSFKDTVTYVFDALAGDGGKNYQLYLPLYNTVTWMEIGVSEGESLQFVKETAKPIIVYGTSIAQGACASRPGLAWTNILQRDLSSPVVNLGFSGNGRLEGPLVDFIASSPAKAIILDCIPNLSIIPERTEQQLDSLIYSAVSTIRKHQPATPIILTEHSSGFDKHILNTDYNKEFQQSTNVLRRTFKRLTKEGVPHIYMLTNKDMGLDINATVDFVHPNDFGMLKIADAYKRLLIKLL